MQMVTSSSSTLTEGDITAKTQARNEHLPISFGALELEYSFVLSVACKMLKDRPNDSRQDEAQELAQKAFFKYCRIANRTTVTYPRTYLYRTLFSLRVDAAREQRKPMGLQVDEQGE